MKKVIIMSVLLTSCLASSFSIKKTNYDIGGGTTTTPKGDSGPAIKSIQSTIQIVSSTQQF